MAFEVYSAESSDKPSIDFEALNKYVVETAQLENGETLIGYISNIVDLGTQKLPDGEYRLDKEDEDLSIDELNQKYAVEISEGKITKFDMAYDAETKSRKIKKFVPQFDRQAITISVDFPDILVDKAPFFGGESKPQPLRLWFGGDFWNAEEKMMCLNSVMPLKKTKDDSLGWTMNPRSTLYKMALAAKVIQQNEAFQPEEVDKLLGKSLQFKAQVYFRESKNGQSYYTEKVSFASGLARGQNPIEDVDAHLIQFYGENDETALRELRNTVINTMSLATNWENSEVKKQLEALGRIQKRPANNNTAQKELPKQDNEEEVW